MREGGGIPRGILRGFVDHEAALLSRFLCCGVRPFINKNVGTHGFDPRRKFGPGGAPVGTLVVEPSQFPLQCLLPRRHLSRSSDRLGDRGGAFNCWCWRREVYGSSRC